MATGMGSKLNILTSRQQFSICLFKLNLIHRRDVFEDLFHVLAWDELEDGLYGLPQLDSGLEILENKLERLRSSLLNLIDVEGHHHQEGEVGGQMFFAMTKVMFEVVLLVFEGIEGFILDLPSASAHFHDLIEVGSGELNLGNPGEGMGLSLGIGELIVEHVDPQVGMGLVEGEIVGIAEVMGSSCVLYGMSLYPSSLLAGLELPKEALATRGLDCDDELPTALLDHSLDEWATGIECIEDKNEVLFVIEGLKVVQEPLSSIALAVIFAAAILLDDRFIFQDKHFFLIRTHDARTQHRMIVRNAPVSMLSLHAVFAMDLL